MEENNKKFEMRIQADRKTPGLAFAAEDGDAGLGEEDLRTWSRHGLWAEEVGCDLWIAQLEDEFFDKAETLE